MKKKIIITSVLLVVIIILIVMGLTRSKDIEKPEPSGIYVSDYYVNNSCGKQLLSKYTSQNSGKDYLYDTSNNAINFYEYDSKGKQYDASKVIKRGKAKLLTSYNCSSDCQVMEDANTELFFSRFSYVFIKDGNNYVLYDYSLGRENYKSENQLIPIYIYTDDYIYVPYLFVDDDTLYDLNGNEINEKNISSYEVVDSGIIFDSTNCSIAAKSNSKYGVVSLINNDEVIPFEYDSIYYSSLKLNKDNEVFLALLNKKITVYNASGEKLFEDTHDRVYVTESDDFKDGIVVLYDAGNIAIKDNKNNSLFDESLLINTGTYCSMQSYYEVYNGKKDENYGVDINYCPVIRYANNHLVIDYINTMSENKTLIVDLINKKYEYK